MAEDAGAYEAIIDGQGSILAVGEALASLIGLSATELIGRPMTRWFKLSAFAGQAGVPALLELRPERRGGVWGLGIRTQGSETYRFCFIPDVARADTSRGSGPDVRLRDLDSRVHSELVREVHDALTGAIGFASLVALAPSAHRRKFYTDQITSQAERCRRLVSALDPQASARAPLMRSVDLATELPRTLASTRTALERSGVSFDLEARHGPVWALCDGRVIADLLACLVMRATLNQRRDYQANEVVVAISSKGGEVKVELVFSGADKPQVLLHERFGLTDEAALAATSGSEFELRLAHAALARQGGTLALSHDAAREEARVTLTLLCGSAPPTLDQARTPVPLEILVVDDDAMLGDLYQELFQVSGHTVTACRSLEAARDALKGQRFDAMIAEFQMRDGLLPELWATASSSHPEIANRLLIVTREPRDPRVVEWAKQEHTPVLAKPFQVSALLDQITLLGQGVTRRQ